MKEDYEEKILIKFKYLLHLIKTLPEVQEKRNVGILVAEVMEKAEKIEDLSLPHYIRVINENIPECVLKQDNKKPIKVYVNVGNNKRKELVKNKDC